MPSSLKKGRNRKRRAFQIARRNSERTRRELIPGTDSEAPGSKGARMEGQRGLSPGKIYCCSRSSEWGVCSCWFYHSLSFIYLIQLCSLSRITFISFFFANSIRNTMAQLTLPPLRFSITRFSRNFVFSPTIRFHQVS